MSPPRYRDSCGSHLGMRLHQEHSEDPCGTCTTAETWRRLLRETVPTRPTPRVDPLLEPVTPEQAAANAHELLTAIDRPDLRIVGGAA